MNRNEDKYYRLGTNKMKNVIDNLLDNGKEEFLYCHNKYLEAKSAIAKLPHINEDGESVVHGCNMYMHNIADYWEIRRDGIKQFLDKKWIEEQGVSYFVYKR